MVGPNARSPSNPVVFDFRKTQIRNRAALQVKQLELHELLSVDKPDRSTIDLAASRIVNFSNYFSALKSEMRHLKCLGMVVLLAILIAVPAAAKDKAKALFQKGEDAEIRQNYEAAYDYFQQAYDLKPQDLRYRLAYMRTRFLAAAAHLRRGQLLRDDGKLQDALAEFQAAKQVDSAQPIIDEEIRRTRALIERLGQAPGQAPQKPSADR